MVRFTIPELLRVYPNHTVGQLVTPVCEQPADPFNGCGDFEVHPLAFELMQERAARRLLMADVMDYVTQAGNVIALLDRPLSKMTKKDLIGLIRIAQDILVQPVEVMS